MDPEFLKRFCLTDGARKAVQNKTVLAILFCNALFHNSEHQFIRNEVAALHEPISLAAKRRIGSDCRTKKRTRGDGGDGKSLCDPGRVGAFTGTRRAQKDHVHSYSKKPLK